MLALVADPHDDTRALYSEFLRLSNWDTEQAGDGREALAKALSGRPDAIVAEAWLPGIDGLELSRLVRADPATAKAKIVIVTADATAAPPDRARAAGIDAVLQKPCPPATIEQTLAALFEATAAGVNQLRAWSRELNDQVGRSHRIIDEAERALRLAAGPTGKPVAEIPVVPPPLDLVCPQCTRPLRYVRSFAGGVRAMREQWDYFDCTGCNVEYQYRQRTRKLRRVT